MFFTNFLNIEYWNDSYYVIRLLIKFRTMAGSVRANYIIRTSGTDQTRGKKEEERKKKEKSARTRARENGHCQKVDVAIAAFFRSRCQLIPLRHRFNLRHPFKCHEYTFHSVASRRWIENTRRFPRFRREYPGRWVTSFNFWKRYYATRLTTKSRRVSVIHHCTDSQEY